MKRPPTMRGARWAFAAIACALAVGAASAAGSQTPSVGQAFRVRVFRFGDHEGKLAPPQTGGAGPPGGGVPPRAVAYHPRFRDRRTRAAVVLAGAPPPRRGPFPQRAPPLLATQGTADRINAPETTASF